MDREKIEKVFEVLNINERIDKTLLQIFHAYPNANRLIEIGHNYKTVLIEAMMIEISNIFTKKEIDEFLEVADKINFKRWLDVFFSDNSSISDLITLWLRIIVTAAVQENEGYKVDPSKLN